METFLFCCATIRTRDGITSRKYDVWTYYMVDPFDSFFFMPIGEKNINRRKFCSLHLFYLCTSLFIYLRIGNRLPLLSCGGDARHRSPEWRVRWKQSVVATVCYPKRGVSSNQSCSVKRTKTLFTYPRLPDLTKHEFLIIPASRYGTHRFLVVENIFILILSSSFIVCCWRTIDFLWKNETKKYVFIIFGRQSSWVHNSVT